MVLSNKKLKQKLRAARAESLTETESGGPDPNYKNETSSANPDPNSELQQLMAAAIQRPRLSKREKRRKTISLQGGSKLNSSKISSNVKEEKKKKTEGREEGDLAGGDENGEDSDNDETQKRKKKKKRKREEGESEENGMKEDGAVKMAKKKKKKKKKKNKRKKEIGEQEIMDVGSGAVEIMGANESQMNEDIAARVYVGGIPYYSTEDDIRSFFESCGTITEVFCMTFPDSGRFRGIAIISFKTEGAAKRALDLDGADMGGFYLKIKPYKMTQTNKVPDFAPRIIEGYNRIYVGNLPWDITEDDLRKFFSDCNVSSIRFGTDKETGEFQGYAHVDFSDDVSLLMALKLDQQILNGRPIKISCAVPKNKANIHQTAVHTSDSTNSVASTNRVDVHSTTVSTSDGTNVGTVSASSGKIKRRTCYECGEKGHISTDCPKKQIAGPVNSDKI